MNNSAETGILSKNQQMNLPYGVIEKSNDPKIIRLSSFQEKNLK